MRLINLLIVMLFCLNAARADGIEGIQSKQRFSFDVSWLYWRPSGATSDYASITALQGTHASVTPLSVQSDYSSGFSIDTSYLFTNDTNDIAFSYVNFNQNYTDGPHHAVGRITTVEVAQPILKANIYDQTHATLNYNYDAYELNTGYLIQWQQLSLKLLAGLRYAELASEIKSFYGMNNGTSLTHLIESDTKALGPTIGIKVTYPLFKDIKLNAMGETGLLVGTTDVQASAINTSGFPFLTAVDGTNNRHTTIPFYDIKFALEKAFTMNRDKQFVLRAGFFGTYYENAYIRRDLTSSAQEKSISFYGPFASIGLTV
ncbi:Lpg1974 family pore-forming outer membrane protein [Legionella quateirensis]|uniref:Major outer membrane protein n=1 Tax=Legionella quateirensis TaxID=45072 RepID=A0A378KUN9_9GAMM|nr:Lpg1974 family pore-forming outer membrane protein [Legionella quateirensis]KTD52997.1 major outer membrane protein [Legionella quateirensis]STY17217.1 major outer membrane protein [Legionella quateirensis]